MSNFHELKTWPEYYSSIVQLDRFKRKTVEIRKDDRDYRVGDTLILREFDPIIAQYTGRQTSVEVTHCLRGQPWVPDGYVAMSITFFVEPSMNMGWIDLSQYEQ